MGCHTRALSIPSACARSNLVGMAPQSFLFLDPPITMGDSWSRMANYSGETPRSLSDLYEELARIRSLLEYYSLSYLEGDEGWAEVVALSHVIKDRESRVIKQIIELQRRL
jgi:hypothetical protein